MKNICRRRNIKILAIVAAIVSSLSFVFFAYSFHLFQKWNISDENIEKEDVLENVFQEYHEESAKEIYRRFYNNEFEKDCNNMGNIIFTIVAKGDSLSSVWLMGDVNQRYSQFKMPYHYQYIVERGENSISYVITTYVDTDYEYLDVYSVTNKVVEFLFKYRWMLLIFAIISFIVDVLAIVVLVVGTGYKDDISKAEIRKVDKIIYIIPVLLTMSSILFTVFFSRDALCKLFDVKEFFGTSHIAVYVGLMILSMVITTLICIEFILTTARRKKSHIFFENTAIYSMLIEKKYSDEAFMRKLEIILTMVGILVIEVFLDWFICISSYMAVMVLVSVVKIIIAIYLIIYIVKIFIIKDRIHEMALGNINCKIDENDIPKGFAGIAKDLNNMSDGMSIAIDKQIKSERMKIEMITNLTHDIKTPLTSIINYSDLLSKEYEKDLEATIESNEKFVCQNIEKEKEYVSIISKHSMRLKTLVDDVLDTSKAVTGNVEVNPEKTDVGMMLSQIIGEYEDKFTSNNLKLVVNKVEEPVYAMIDGTKMFRAFDNVFNNALKYSMPNTRVFVDLKADEDNIFIEIKNISSDELENTPEELMERFVRGDKSRHTEGNGLGLSIAKGFVEALGGQMSVDIDGDVFKVKFVLNTIK